MTAPAQGPYYAEDVDFRQLASENPSFGALLAANDGRIDWQDPKSLQCLTSAILARDFSLSLQLPNDRLCPPIPVRWNYIRWIQDLLATTQPAGQVTGLDIGTGASAIYALLACTIKDWRMFGTDIDDKSAHYAQTNVELNNLQSRIRISRTTPGEALIPLQKLEVEELDFVVCNPPFYSSESDMQAAYASNPMPASAVCTGSTNEMIGPGGDVGFASRLIAESLFLRQKVKWYSCMLSRLISLHQVIAKIKEAGIGNWAVTNLQAGQKTRRWAVAWSFCDRRPENGVARHGELVLGVLPPATGWTIAVAGISKRELGEKVDGVMKGLDVQWMWKESILTGMAMAKGNVWSRAARRKRAGEALKAPADESEESGTDSEDADVALAVMITCIDGRADVRWLRGHDYVLWESFCGMLKRALGAKGKAG